MNSLDALRRMIAGYPGGRPALAADVLVAITQSKADGNISDIDRAYVLRERGQTLAAMQEVYAALEAEHAADNARSAH